MPPRLLLADVLSTYVENVFPQPLDWDGIRDELIDALRGSDFGAWLRSKNAATEQRAVTETLGALLSHPADTGFEPTCTLNIAWFRLGEDQLGLNCDVTTAIYGLGS